jgi:hypothetical protein
MKLIFSNASAARRLVQNSIKAGANKSANQEKNVLASANFLTILVKGEKIGVKS